MIVIIIIIILLYLSSSWRKKKCVLTQKNSIDFFFGKKLGKVSKLSLPVCRRSHRGVGGGMWECC